MAFAAASSLKTGRSGTTTTLPKAIASTNLMGGTTLRDFVNSDGQPGYFAQSLLVYGRGGKPCPECQATLREIRMNQRATVYCTRCQR